MCHKSHSKMKRILSKRNILQKACVTVKLSSMYRCMRCSPIHLCHWRINNLVHKMLDVSSLLKAFCLSNSHESTFKMVYNKDYQHCSWIVCITDALRLLFYFDFHRDTRYRHNRYSLKISKLWFWTLTDEPGSGDSHMIKWTREHKNQEYRVAP